VKVRDLDVHCHKYCHAGKDMLAPTCSNESLTMESRTHQGILPSKYFAISRHAFKPSLDHCFEDRPILELLILEILNTAQSIFKSDAILTRSPVARLASSL